MKLTLLAICAVLLTMQCRFTEAKENLPNVIVIFADDLGPGMLGCYGQKIITTPNIDRLAAEGMRFTNYYGATFCAPSRWSLATGMHDGRIGGWDYNRAGLSILRDSGEITEQEYQKRFLQMKQDAHPIAPDEVLLGQIGQQAGYVTAQFGKLDSGFLTWHERVKRYGWDFYEGFFDHRRCHGYYPPYLWRNGERFELPGNHDPECGKYLEGGDKPAGSGGETHSQTVFIEGVLKFIREHKEKPFFLYHPTQLPHGEIGIPQVHADFEDDARLTYEEKKYASMIKMLDDHVGLIMAELKKQNIDDNTMVIFTSDNGHGPYYSDVYEGFKNQTLPDGTSADLADKKWRTSNGGDVFDGGGGLAGAKRSGFQGGIQCPLIARWPGKIKSDSQTKLLSTHYDLLATLADIGDVKVPKGKDSVSYLPTLLGKTQQQTHEYVVFQNRRTYMGSSAVIDREGWKLIEIQKKNKPESYQLYNVMEDNFERKDLADQHPEQLERLKKILNREVVSARPTSLLEPESTKTLVLPPINEADPSAGKRVRVTPPEYAQTNVFHTVYLPENWRPKGQPTPIVFEYTGNYHPKTGSTGRIEDAGLGYSISGGEFIWVTLPFIDANRQNNDLTWWGNEQATVDYAKANVPRVIKQFNADPDAVILCGFSRGSIAVNAIGLFDDEISQLWSAFLTHDHFLGTKFFSPLASNEDELQRRSAECLKRVQGRPYFVSSNKPPKAAQDLVQRVLPDAKNFKYQQTPTASILGEFPNQYAKAGHNDRWALVPSTSRTSVWKWMNEVVASKQK